MFQHSLCAFLAPAVVSAMAFPWAGPEPTLVVPAADNWSPATTAAPRAGAMELFKRADPGDNTCGYLSAISSLSLTCNNPNYVCATNSFYGVHGCCDPNGISTCSIPTTCIASTDMASCGSSCMSNSYIAKCTDSQYPSCYEWIYVYSTTSMIEHGCNSIAFTSSVSRNFRPQGNSGVQSFTSDEPVFSQTADSTTSRGRNGPSTTSSSSGTTATGQGANGGTDTPEPTTKPKKTNIGAIVGGVVGGLVVLGALAFGIVFLILRSRKNKTNATNAATGVTTPMIGGAQMGPGPAPGVTEYKPQPGGFPSPGQQYANAAPAAGGYYHQDVKPGFQQQGVPGQEIGGQNNPYSPPGSPAPQYPGPAMQSMNPVPAGVAEAGGTPIQNPNAAAAPHHPNQQNIYEAP